MTRRKGRGESWGVARANAGIKSHASVVCRSQMERSEGWAPGPTFLDPLGNKWRVSADSLSILLLVFVVADTSRQDTGRNYWLVSMD